MIKKVEIKNWKSHSNSEFEFGKGTNVIVGVMGSGKSAVMDAICFALYGTFPALNNRRVSLEETIMNKPLEQDEAHVAVEFDYAGNEYRAERTITRKGQNHGKLFQGGRLIAGPKMRDVTSHIERLLEVNFELFSRAIYSEQNNIDYFLRLTPAQRKEKMDELLQLNRYETARANAVLVGNRLKDIANERGIWVEQQKRELAGENLPALKKRLGEKEFAIKEMSVRIEKLSSAAEEKKKSLAEMEKHEREFRLLEEKSISLKARVYEIERAIKSAEQGRGKDEIANEIKKNIARKNALEKLIPELESALKKCDEKSAEFAGKTEANESRMNDINDVISRLKTAEAKCPVCKHELSTQGRAALVNENSALLTKLADENKKNSAELRQLRDARTEITGERGKTEAELRELAEAKARLGADEERISKLEGQKKEHAKILAEQAAAEKTLANHPFKREKFETMRRESADACSELEATKKELEGYIALAREMLQNIGRVEKAAERLEQEATGVVKLKEAVAKLAVFTNALKAAQIELRMALIDAVNEAMSDIWGRVYPYNDYTGAKVEVSEGSYEIMVRERSGKWIRAEGILSGGERSAAAITIRIAVSLMLTQNLSWLVLDEPTHNLDSNAVARSAEMLRSHLPELVEQVFIITHEKAMESAASSNLYRLERNKSEDGATKVVVEAVT
ncbi:AAA family ATPase [Candidatus Micrarchaeota archaeon]|nr:AAA family ATPase [Candidatus Micrarchaeota archaeon]